MHFANSYPHNLWVLTSNTRTVGLSAASCRRRQTAQIRPRPGMTSQSDSTSAFHSRFRSLSRFTTYSHARARRSYDGPTSLVWVNRRVF